MKRTWGAPLAGFIIVFALAISAATVAGEVPVNPVFAKRAGTVFENARRKFLTSSNETKNAWEFARACFDWAEFSTTSDSRAAIAQQGIDASRMVVAKETNSAPGFYYLAMNLGQMARTKSLGALKLVKEMESSFKRAIDLEPTFDHAGAVRSLGILYLEAPGWPTSIGSNRKALVLLKRAVELCPDFPENLLCLTEANLRLEDKKSALIQFRQLPSVMEPAKKAFAGEEWEAWWVDWDHRAGELREKLTQKPSH